MAYAFLFQEGMFKWEILYDPFVLFMAGFGIPLDYGVANSMMGFWQSDVKTNVSWDVYPGGWQCKHQQGHSIWHEVTAKGLLDMIFLANYMTCLVERRDDFMLLSGIFC